MNENDVSSFSFIKLYYNVTFIINYNVWSVTFIYDELFSESGLFAQRLFPIKQYIKKLYTNILRLFSTRYVTVGATW